MDCQVLQGLFDKSFFRVPPANAVDDQGLGTSKDTDARDYFSNMAKHMIPFATTQDGDRELIDLAFSKKKADDRKEWLRQFRVSLHNLV